MDEFQNFVNSGFDSILSEARKYRLNLSLCHQYIGQLSEALQNSVFGNVGTLISFRIGSSDAEHISREMDNTYPSKRFTELDKYEIYIKLMQNGELDPHFWARALAPIEPNALQAEKIIRVSRERFARDRLTVEGKIKRWLEWKSPHTISVGAWATSRVTVTMAFWI